ncbi:uncharacterized protein BT62DRAFT_1033271 [Guyanagaster necrorhizus]|uniref:Yeast cell wall synthesis Kre9/Knh1-like N-terminal domain-containing protein n=1 Tax=Guyanagaster necrorhizus TaxID=856835 RepID=A0A9P7VNJ4_9AGAR|nr:uncharacterized protein BT62DRAFT_1033271 [Guyanagaster necrorhizus MCA 3950]KAG7443742.1 hypothetical protein BT62DRAFT_1033271 [Guyanagaster necrorhizus MCA 3950]
MLAFISLFVLPFVHALTVNNLNTTVSSAGPITVTWTVSAGDPDTFSIELINQGFNRQFAVANNVDADLQSITLSLPELPTGSGFTTQLVNVSNINDVFAQTGDFSVAAASSSSTSASSTASNSASLISASAIATTMGSAISSGVSSSRSVAASSAGSASASSTGSLNSASRLELGSGGALAAMLGWVLAL